METLWQQFVHPPQGYGSIPWWIWNGRMEYAEMERQLRLMKEAGLDGWMLWVRFGVEVEYLSRDFFDRLRFAVQKSAELGLDVWIFDEYAWPSGSAHNLVPRNHPEYRMRVLSCLEARVTGPGPVHLSFPPPAPAEVLAALPAPEGVYVEGELPQDDRRIERVVAVPVVNGRLDPNRAIHVTDAVSGLDVDWEAPAGEWFLLVLLSRDYRNYIDAVNPEAVRAFIHTTHEQYQHHLGDYFGSVVKGFFLDEPRYIRHGREKPQFEEPTIPWSHRLFERLEERGLKPIDPCLAAVFCEVEGKEAALRVQFWKALMELYREAYFQQLSDWAEQHGLVYCGDCFTEESEILVNQGDYFQTAAPLHIPGMDSLGDVPLENPTVRKGPKFPSSLAHAASHPSSLISHPSSLRNRCLAEGPGLLGWDCTLERLKACTDWPYAYGINMLVPNAFFYTVAHEQFYETPSYFHQWTLWPYYPVYDAYVRRLSFLLSQGHHQADVALFYPTATFLKNYWPLPTALRLHRGPFADATPPLSPPLRRGG
jgi:hypothetical protein